MGSLLRTGLVLFLIQSALVAQALPKALPAAPFSPDELRESVIDHLFPWQDGNRANGLLRVGIRFRPSFSLASHLMIEFRGDGARIEYLAVDERSLQGISESSSQDPSEAARSIPVIRRVLQLSEVEAKDLQDQLWTSVAQSQAVFQDEVGNIQLDGTRYEIRIHSQLSTETIVRWDAEAYPNSVTGAAPVVEWANRLRLRMLSLAPATGK